jgi:hypothetical protein
MKTFPSEFERLVNGKVARSYLLQKDNIARTLAEIWGSEELLAEWFGKDMKHFNEFQKELEKLLPCEREKRIIQVYAWIQFLKLRVDLLEFGVGHYSSLGGYLAGSFALLAVVGAITSSTRSALTVAACAAVVAMLFAAVRAMIERRRAWYRYLITYLESIKEGDKSAG